MRRIGVLMPAASDNQRYQVYLAAFLQGLQQLGWADGRNVRIDTRWGALNADLMRKYAGELLALEPDVVMAPTSDAVSPLRQVTRTVPIVFATVADAVGVGWNCARSICATPARSSAQLPPSRKVRMAASS